MKGKERKYQKGITLIALVITIVVLLILAGVTLSIVFNGGIINKSQTAVDKYTEESAKEKLTLALWDYKMGVISGGDTNLQSYLDKINAEIIDTTDTEYIIELDGYEFIVDKPTLNIISSSKSGGVRPIPEISIYQEDGSAIVDGEKYETLVLTVKISNKSELTSIDEIILKDEKGNLINPSESIIGDSTADKSFIINKNGTYKVFAKGTKDDIQKTGKKEIKLSLFTNIIYIVSYTDGIDNMEHWTTYNKTQETATNEETTKLNEIKAIDSDTTYNRAVKNDNGTITAIAEETRTSDDEQIYLYGKYTLGSTKKYKVQQSSSYSKETYNKNYRGYGNYSISSTGQITLSNFGIVNSYSTSGLLYSGNSSAVVSGNTFYYYVYDSDSEDGNSYIYRKYTMTKQIENTYYKGSFIEYNLGGENEYPSNNHNGSYWYVRENLMKKYKLYKYDEDLTLKSTYDIENKEIKTVPIDISDKSNNKVMLTIDATGSNYKVFISGDNSNWQQVENITSGTLKEIEVTDWNNLYIKIETNTSTINGIEVAYAE